MNHRPEAVEEDPRIRYMPCPDHEAAIEVEGYCPCFDGLEIDWERTLGVEDSVEAV